MTHSIPYAWFDGAFIDTGAPALQIHDRGLLYGDGIFETIAVHNAIPHLLSRHLDRLARSALFLGIELPPHDMLERVAHELPRRNRIPDCALRITITRGVAEGLLPTANLKATAIVSLRHRRIGATAPLHGVLLKDVIFRPPSIARRCKTLDYIASVVAAGEIHRNNADEGLLMDETGFVVEGSVSNLAVVKDGALITPTLQQGVLPGITRGRMIELAQQMGIEVIERRIHVAELSDVQEILVTNSLRRIASIVALDNRPICDGVTGPVAAQLSELFDAELANAEL